MSISHFRSLVSTWGGRIEGSTWSDGCLGAGRGLAGDLHTLHKAAYWGIGYE